MNKKGFTLIELIAVIVIIAAITILTIPPILDSINKNKETISESSNRLVFTATDLYIDDYMGEIPDDLKNAQITVCVPVNRLVQLRLLDEKIYDEKSESGIAISDIVKVTIYNNVKEKELVKDGACETHYEYIDDDGEVNNYKPKVITDSTATHKGIVYLNPKNLSVVCNESNSQIGTGTPNPSGCMKFYVYDDSGDTYKMILDHNTSSRVQWINTEDYQAAVGGDGYFGTSQELLNSCGPITANRQLAQDTSGWLGSPRFITAQEIADATNTVRNMSNVLTPTEYGNAFFYFNGLGADKYTPVESTSPGDNEYSWLFDYLKDCEDYGCKVEDSSAYSYWTSTPVMGYDAWVVWRDGCVSRTGGLCASLNCGDPTDDGYYSGVRPVIELPKSSFVVKELQ